MKLQIPKDKAIEALKNRISEIDNLDFNPDAWKERTILDLKEIFPIGSTQYIKIQFLRFETFITSEKEKVFSEAKITAKKILNSYIDFIIEYSKVAEERHIIKEKDYEQKYYELLKERNDVVQDYNDLIKNTEEQIDINSELLDQIQTNNNELQTIRENTIQFDNVSMNKLFKAFLNLPILQIVSVFSVIIAITVGCFALGKTYQENASNNDLFDVKVENKELKQKMEKNNIILQKKNNEVNELKNEVDILKNPKKKD